jgi:nucleoside diphosphate kinase
MQVGYVAVLIKPDAIRDVLDEMILHEIISKTSAIPIFRKLWKITQEEARLIYPDWIENPKFPSISYNITQGYSLFVLVMGSIKIHQELIRIKGKMNKGGIRLKFRTHSIEEWKALGYHDQGLSNKIAENRLHTTDNIEETIRLSSLIMDHNDIAYIEKSHPLLAFKIHQRNALLMRTE